MKKALILSSVASMIRQFNMGNINILKKNGYNVSIICNFQDPGTIPKHEAVRLIEELEFMNVTVFDIEIKRNPINLENIKAYQKIKNIIEKEKFEIIHCHSPVGGVLARLASKNERKNGSKVIYTAHGFHFFKGASLVDWLLFYPIEKWLAKYTDELIVINKEDYRNAKKFKTNNVRYVPGVGVDIEKFRNLQINKKEKRKSIQVDFDDFLILSVGELNKNKNHQIIIKAIAKLKNKKIKYVISGQGVLEKELKKLASDLGVDHQVKFLGYRTDIPELMSISDLYAFPSYREGLSLSLMEAMASGLPVICSDIRGNSDLVKDGKGGYCIEPSNLDKFSETIETLFNDISLREKYSSYNFNTIKKYSIKKISESMENIYMEQNYEIDKIVTN